MKLNGKQKQALNNALINAFRRRDLLAQMMVFQMEENLEMVAGGETYPDVVFNLIEWADSQGRLKELITGARAQNSGNEVLLAFAVEVGLESPPEPPRDEEQAERPDSDIFPTLLRLIPQSHEYRADDIESLALLYRRARQASRAVCRIEGYQSMATGFLVAPDIILTAYFVVQDLIEDASYIDPTTKEETPLQPSNIAFRFGYERLDEKGYIPTGQIYKLAPEWHIASSPIGELDFALLKLHAAAGHDLLHLDGGPTERGWLKPAAEPRIGIGERLYLLHHPAGSPLKFSPGMLLGPAPTPSRCAYAVFTEPGSSGAPCFNEEWEVLALHEKREMGEAQNIRSGVLLSEIIKRADVRAALNL